MKHRFPAIYFEATRLCNLSCPICMTSQQRPGVRSGEPGARALLRGDPRPGAGPGQAARHRGGRMERRRVHAARGRLRSAAPDRGARIQLQRVQQLRDARPGAPGRDEAGRGRQADHFRRYQRDRRGERVEPQYRGGPHSRGARDLPRARHRSPRHHHHRQAQHRELRANRRLPGRAPDLLQPLTAGGAWLRESVTSRRWDSIATT